MTRKRATKQEAASKKEVASASVPPKDRRAKAMKRALGLIARAAHAGTPEEEARTSALFAAKMIQEENLLDAREVEPRHPLFDRLEGLDDRVLDRLGGVIEAELDGGGSVRGMARANRKSSQLESAQVERWREEAIFFRRKLDTFAGALRWILRGYKIGLVERPGYCVMCRQAFMLGEIAVWKRRKIDCAHYTCCVASFQQQGAIA